MVSFLHVAQLLIICVVFVSGCFITNCPPGGKRSEKEERKTHECEQCGPPGLDGRCYGPQICCSPMFGCLVGAQVTTACQHETRSPSLCHNQGVSCDGSGETGPINGQCAAMGICCTPETCTMDDDCVTSGDHLPSLSDLGRGRHGKHGPLGAPHSEELPLIHAPVDSWFYRRLIHSKGKALEGDNLPFALPQGPSYFPPGPPRLGDYF